MNGQRTALWAIALVALIAAIAYRIQVFSEPPAAPPPTIVFVTGGSGPFWELTVAGAKAAAEKEKAELIVQMPESNANLEQQMAILARLDEKTDGLAISPTDSEGQTHLINELAEKMRVVTFDSDAKLSERHSHIGASNFSAGRACARLVGEALPAGGKIAVLISNQTQENLIERRGGFRERIGQMDGDEGADGKVLEYKIVAFVEDGGEEEKCRENIRQILKENPDLACIVGMNAMHGPLLLEELKEAGQLGKIKLVTFDAEDETLDGVEQGYIYATIAQDPYKYGFEAVNTLVKLCAGEGTDLPIVGRGATYVGVEALKQDNLQSFRDAMRGRAERAKAKEKEKAAS